jgi:uncharacterized membrane protein YgcG
VHESYRFDFWRWAIGRGLDYAIFHPLHGGDTVGYYLHHRALLTSTTTKKTSGQLGEIMRDVGRTYPEHPFFNPKKKQPGEILLARVLCATLSSTPNIGYCQGMNFVVATLLLARIPKDMIEESYRKEEQENEERRAGDEDGGGADNSTAVTERSFDDSNITQYDEIEADVFWMFQSILIKNDQGLEMEFIWKPSFPKMKLRVFQFDRLLELYLPAIHSHFEEMNLSPEVVVSQWFMTLFSNTIPLPFTFYMWDYVFVSNWPGIFRVTLAILYVLKDKLLDMDLEEVGLLIRDWKRGKFDIPVSFSELLCSAETFPIDLTSLVLLQENYALEMIAAAIGDQLDATSSVGKSYHGGCMGLPRPGGDSWLRRYGEFPEEMRAEMLLVHDEINGMSVQVDKDKAVLQNKILKACELCEHAYDDLDKAIRKEMQWLQHTSNLKHDLSCWEKKAKTALAELKWANENESQRATRNCNEEEEEEEEEEDSDEDEEDDDSDNDYSGSSESCSSSSSGSSSGEYMDEEGSNSSDGDEYVSDSSSEYTSASPSPQGGGGGGGGGSYFFDAVANMTNMLIPVAAPQPPVAVTQKVVMSHDNHNTPIPQFQNSGLVTESMMPQKTEYDDNRHAPSPLNFTSPPSTPASSPEGSSLPVSSSADAVAEKIKCNPQRRRTVSNPGFKQPTNSPAASPVTSPVTTPLSLEGLSLNEEVDNESTRNHSTSALSAPSGAQPVVANNTISIASNSPQLQESSTPDALAPQSSTRFQNFKSTVLRRSGSGGGGGGSEGGRAGGGGGGRVGFSRRYITSKLERRKAKIMKAKECHFLHKQIIKTSK